LDIPPKLVSFDQMKKIFAIVLVMLMLLQCSIKFMYVAYYNINKEYIAKELCINKAKPASTCKGKCYLSRKMKEQEKQEQTIPSVVKGLEEAVFYSPQDTFIFTPVYTIVEQVILPDAYQARAYHSAVADIIQPPQ
jgi:hypothetical protein